MPNDQDVYSGLLESFRKTLKETSKDDSNNCFMTESQASVVDFDAFKEFVARGCPHMPMSCDALYRHEDGTWFLIEFKNGKLLNKRGPDSQEFFKIIRKLFESLFLLTQKLKETIEFTKERLIFILVNNEENNGFLKTKD